MHVARILLQGTPEPTPAPEPTAPGPTPEPEPTEPEPSSCGAGEVAEGAALRQKILAARQDQAGKNDQEEPALGAPDITAVHHLYPTPVLLFWSLKQPQNLINTISCITISYNTLIIEIAPNAKSKFMAKFGAIDGQEVNPAP